MIHCKHCCLVFSDNQKLDYIIHLLTLRGKGNE